MIGTNIKFNITVEKTYIEVIAEDKDNKLAIGSCKVDYDKDEITIASWFVNKKYQHIGIGKKILAEAVNKVPNNFNKVKYIWNGRNEYVLNWMENHFNAKNLCPIHMLKYSYIHSDDVWDLHLYSLDTEMFIKYIKEIE